MKKKCEKNYFKGPKMTAKDDATILFAATILTAPTVYGYVCCEDELWDGVKDKAETREVIVC